MYCQIGSVLSEGVKTGVSVVPGSLYLWENGDIDRNDNEPNITLTLHTPLKCDHQHSCSLQIDLRIINNCKFRIFYHVDLTFLQLQGCEEARTLFCQDAT